MNDGSLAASTVPGAFHGVDPAIGQLFAGARGPGCSPAQPAARRYADRYRRWPMAVRSISMSNGAVTLSRSW